MVNSNNPFGMTKIIKGSRSKITNRVPINARETANRPQTDKTRGIYFDL
jgi:hypothetical protein